MARCYAEYPKGSHAYNALKTMADAGASDALAAERQLLGQQQGLFGYTSIGLLSDQNFDAVKRINNTYQVIPRAAGTAQAGLSAVALTGEGLACTTGMGCALALTTGTIIADFGIAGLKQAVTGNAALSYGEQLLEGLGMSPQAAALAYASLGLAPAAVQAGIVNKAINLQNAANAWARGTYTGQSAITYEGTVYRFTDAKYSGVAWEIHPRNVAANYRYSPPGVGSVYSGTTSKTARAEAASYPDGLDGKVLVGGNTVVENVLDLTNPAALRALGVTKKEIVLSSHGANGSYTQTQRIAEWAREQGYNGILTPSAQTKSGTNLITFDSTMVISP